MRLLAAAAWSRQTLAAKRLCLGSRQFRPRRWARRTGSISSYQRMSSPRASTSSNAATSSTTTCPGTRCGSSSGTGALTASEVLVHAGFPANGLPGGAPRPVAEPRAAHPRRKSHSQQQVSGLLSARGRRGRWQSGLHRNARGDRASSGGRLHAIRARWCSRRRANRRGVSPDPARGIPTRREPDHPNASRRGVGHGERSPTRGFLLRRCWNANLSPLRPNVGRVVRLGRNQTASVRLALASRIDRVRTEIARRVLAALDDLAVFDIWRVAQEDIHASWMVETDPANLLVWAVFPQILRVADFIR